MLSKQKSFLFFIILIMLTVSLPKANALGVGPPYLEFDLLPDGSNSTTVYVTSGGLSGELIIGSEGLPFRVEPSKINMTSSDANVPVELTFYGNETLESGVYIGLVTFYADTGGFIAYRIRIWATINLLGEAQVREDEEEPETPDEEEESEEEPEAETEPESEEESEIFAEEEEPEEESQDNSNPYFIGGVTGAAVLGVLVVVVLRWKK